MSHRSDNRYAALLALNPTSGRHVNDLILSEIVRAAPPGTPKNVVDGKLILHQTYGDPSAAQQNDAEMAFLAAQGHDRGSLPDGWHSYWAAQVSMEDNPFGF